MVCWLYLLVVQPVTFAHYQHAYVSLFMCPYVSSVCHYFWRDLCQVFLCGSVLVSVDMWRFLWICVNVFVKIGIRVFAWICECACVNICVWINISVFGYVSCMSQIMSGSVSEYLDQCLWVSVSEWLVYVYLVVWRSSPVASSTSACCPLTGPCSSPTHTHSCGVRVVYRGQTQGLYF